MKATDKRLRTEFSQLSNAVKYQSTSNMTLLVVAAPNNMFYTMRPKHALQLVKENANYSIVREA